MLQKFIQWLLDSRTTPAQAAHSAMPKNEGRIAVTNLTMDSNWHYLVAPFDGYFSVKGNSKRILVENSSSMWQGVSGLANPQYMGFSIPMVKGEDVGYQIGENSTGVFVYFIKSIGGGIKVLLGGLYYA